MMLFGLIPVKTLVEMAVAFAIYAIAVHVEKKVDGWDHED